MRTLNQMQKICSFFILVRSIVSYFVPTILGKQCYAKALMVKIIKILQQREKKQIT